MTIENKGDAVTSADIHMINATLRKIAFRLAEISDAVSTDNDAASEGKSLEDA